MGVSIQAFKTPTGILKLIALVRIIRKSVK